MATLYEMQTKLRNYYNLRDNLSYVIRYINNTIDDLRPSVEKFLAAYSVDEGSKGRVALSKHLEELVEKRDTIKNAVIPAINSEISKLKKNIEEEQLKLT